MATALPFNFMPLNNIKTFHLFVLAVFIVAGVTWFIFSNEIPQNTADKNATPSTFYEVAFTDTGYIPAEITIARGDGILWRNESSSMFWPASNLHPSHRDYPDGAFDPKAPFAPGQHWSFRFDVAGDWRYHDHLNPYHTGIVHVSE